MTKSPSGTFSEKERGGVISYARKFSLKIQIPAVHRPKET